MSNVLVVVGSARTGRVAEKVTDYVKKDLEARDGVTVTVADLKEVNLPFFDNEQSPASPDYAPTNAQVVAWSELVKANDSVVFVTPEYNHELSAIEKNAIDTLFSEWKEKPVTAVAYGWTGGSLAVDGFERIFTHLGADLKHDIAKLAFMKDLNPDGSILDETSVNAQISLALDHIS